MPRKIALTYFFVSAGSIVVGGAVGALLFPHHDPHIAQPIAQAVGLMMGFLLLWPLEVRHQPQRRVQTFPVYAALMIGICAAVVALRIVVFGR